MSPETPNMTPDKQNETAQTPRKCGLMIIGQVCIGGCGESLPLEEAFRCADCLAWFHRDCINQHFELDAYVKALRDKNNRQLIDERNEAQTRLADETKRADDAERERDKWKASHDNQVNLRRALMDRPDLKERAFLVQGLATERDALKAKLEALTAENATFRNAQKACEDCDAPTVAEVKELRAKLNSITEAWKNGGGFNLVQAIQTALTQPAKPTP